MIVTFVDGLVFDFDFPVYVLAERKPDGSGLGIEPARYENYPATIEVYTDRDLAEKAIHQMDRAGAVPYELGEREFFATIDNLIRATRITHVSFDVCTEPGIGGGGFVPVGDILRHRPAS